MDTVTESHGRDCPADSVGGEAAPSPDSQQTRDCPRVALSLSGGGLRATFFHLGVLRYLHDVGWLRHIRHISSVSGGSITAADLVLHWGDVLKPGGFKAMASRLITFSRTDLRNRVLRRWPILHLAGLVLPRSRLSLSGYFGHYYGRRLYDRRRLRDLAGGGRPEIHLLSSNLSRPDHLCSFSASGFHAIHFDSDSGAWVDELVKTGVPSIGYAVAASSCFPGFFPPMPLDAGILDAEKRDFRHREYLVDGGVFDNLGLLSLRIHAEHSEFDLAISSDAGGMPDHSSKAYRSVMLSVPRVTDILMERVRHYELLSAHSRFVGAGARETSSDAVRYCHLAIRTVVDDAILNADVQRRSARMRTDLDRFSDEEIRVLVRHGQLVARAQLAADKRLAEPPDYKVWDPFGREETAATEALDRSSDRRLRFGWDRIWVLYSLALVAILAIGAFYMFVRPRIDTVLYSELHASPNAVGIENQGFRVYAKTIDIDLSHEVPVNESARDQIRLCPSVQDITLSVVKDESNPRYLALESVSQRRLNEHFVLTHPYEIRFRRTGGIVERGLDNIWTIIVDTEQHIPIIPFDVKYRTIRYNAYQAANRNYVGGIAGSGMESLVIRAKLPEGKVLADKPELKERIRGTTKERPFSGTETLLVSPDGRSFEWRISHPTQDMIYKAYINWADS